MIPLIKLDEIYAAVLLATLFVLVFRDGAGIAKTGRHEARAIHAMTRQPCDHRLALRESCEVEVVTDSEYLKNGITLWIHGWKRKGWMTSEKKPVVNQDLWQALDELVARHKTRWTWTKGHASHADNNRCDELASRAAKEQKSGSKPK